MKSAEFKTELYHRTTGLKRAYEIRYDQRGRYEILCDGEVRKAGSITGTDWMGLTLTGKDLASWAKRQAIDDIEQLVGMAE